MNGLKTTIYRKSKDLPEVEGGNFFHSKQLFEFLQKTPRQKPYMVVVEDEQGRILSHMLGFLRYRTFIFPPFLLVHCRVLGEGEYAESEYPKEELFHNSLHSHAPEERITEKLQKRIDTAHERGVRTEVVSTEEDFKAFSKLLRRHNILKPKRFIPDDTFFRQMKDCDNARLFVTKYHGKVIGCSACAYSQGNAYLWYSAFRRKTYMHLHPDVLTIWDTMKDAYDRGYQHMCFMDVGLPFSKNPFRDFILRFGGKEQSTYRWFRFSIKWVNKLLAWIYRE